MDGVMGSHYSNEHASCKVVRNQAICEAAAEDNIREIVSVWTDPGHRKQGYATQLMQSVCSAADDSKTVLMLAPKEYGNSKGLKKLERWYLRFGFIRIQEAPILMARAPTFNLNHSALKGATSELLRGA